MGEFTPGPWLAGTGGGGGATTYVYEDDGNGQQCRAVAACTLDFVNRPMREREANARLIAAAPELYEALDEARDMLALLNRRFESDFDQRSKEVDKSLANIDAALAKASAPNPMQERGNE